MSKWAMKMAFCNGKICFDATYKFIELIGLPIRIPLEKYISFLQVYVSTLFTETGCCRKNAGLI